MERTQPDIRTAVFLQFDISGNNTTMSLRDTTSHYFTCVHLFSPTCSSFLLYFPRCRNKYFFKFGNRILVAHACYIIAHDTFRRFAALCNKSSVIVRQRFYIIHIISIQLRNQLDRPLLLHFLQVDSDKDCQT